MSNPLGERPGVTRGQLASGTLDANLNDLTVGGDLTVTGSVIVQPRTAASVAALSSRLADELAAGTYGADSLFLNSQAVGGYDAEVIDGPTTLATQGAADALFTATEDTRSAWIVHRGNLTIGSGVTLRPSVRKLFTVLYVDGDLTVTGDISMTARGANHNGTGVSGFGAVFPGAAIRLVAATVDSVVNPQVPAAGGAGATARTLGAGNTGTAGSAGGTGGGGSGGAAASGSTSGAGADGTAFSGGSGSGGVAGTGTGTNATANGGAGTTGVTAASNNRAQGGGAGNNGGPGTQTGDGTGSPGVNGTGGVLIILVTGTLSGAGNIVAAGSAGGAAETVTGSDTNVIGGGGSGGGSVTVICAADTSTITPSSAGGAGGVGTYNTGTTPTEGARNGGAGGAGTARILEQAGWAS